MKYAELDVLAFLNNAINGSGSFIQSFLWYIFLWYKIKLTQPYYVIFFNFKPNVIEWIIPHVLWVALQQPENTSRSYSRRSVKFPFRNKWPNQRMGVGTGHSNSRC